MGVFLRWDVLHNQVDRIDDMTMRITSWDTGAEWRRVAASSNKDYLPQEVLLVSTGVASRQINAFR